MSSVRVMNTLFTPTPFSTTPVHIFTTPKQTFFFVDGGEALQNNPIFPMLEPARGVDVLLVNDNSADTSNNFPNGSEILTTYVQSLNAGLTKMPVIPSVETFIAEGLNTRPTFFGCNDQTKLTIVCIPNVNILFQVENRRRSYSIP
jgi:lysophospholipase